MRSWWPKEELQAWLEERIGPVGPNHTRKWLEEQVEAQERQEAQRERAAAEAPTPLDALRSRWMAL